MKIQHLLPIAILFLFTTPLLAQIDGSPRQFESTSQVYDELLKIMNSREKIPYEIDWENVQGSPYLNEEYKLAKLYVGEKSYGNIMMRFNTYTNEIELYPKEGEESEALMKLDDSRILFEDKTLEVFDFTDDEGVSKKGYFLVLSDQDDVKLLLRKKCVFSPNEKALTANQADRKAKFTQYNYFYVVKNGELIQVEPRKKDIIKLFPKKEKEIKKYIKSEKLRLKDSEDLAKLIDHVATL